MPDASGMLIVPPRRRLVWLLLSVPSAISAGVLSIRNPGHNHVGHVIAGCLFFAWVVFICAMCTTVWRRGAAALVLDGHGIRFPYLRIFVPWADLETASVRHKSQQLRLTVREGGGIMLPGRKPSRSPVHERLKHRTLQVPQLLVDTPLSVIADTIGRRGPIERPSFRLRVSFLERTAIGEGIVLLAWSGQKGHLDYQGVYFWAALVIAGISFVDRRSPEWALGVIIAVNVAVMTFVVVAPGPPTITRVTALFSLTFSLAGIIVVGGLPTGESPPPGVATS